MRDLDPRVIYSAERTMLSWIRTGLAMMGFGFVVAKFGQTGISIWIGTVIVAMGVFCNTYAGMLYAREVDRIKKGDKVKMTRWPVGRIISAVLGLLGLLMVAYLLRMGLHGG